VFLVRIGVACAILIPYVLLRPGQPMWHTFIAAFVAFGLGRVVELLWTKPSDDATEPAQRRPFRLGPVVWLVVGVAVAAIGVFAWAQMGKADRQREAREQAREARARARTRGSAVLPPANAAPPVQESASWWVYVAEGQRNAAFTVTVTLRDGRGEREIVAQQFQRKHLRAIIQGDNLVSATVGDEFVSRRDSDFWVDLDTYTPIFDRSPREVGVENILDPGPSRRLVFEVEVADAAGRTGRGSITVHGSGADNVAFYRELYAVSKGGLSWAAAYDAASPPHPILWLQTTREFGGNQNERELDSDEPSPLPSMATDHRFLPDFPKVRDVQLVAISDLRERRLGWCKTCTGLGNDDDRFRCERTDWTYHTTVYAARTGKRIARKEFRGAPPPKCTRDISSFDTSGEIPTKQVAEWLTSLHDGKSK
jgi:hypothetical protein